MKNKKTGQYWTGIYGDHEPDFYAYTNDLQRAYVLHEEDLFELYGDNEFVKLEYALKEIKHKNVLYVIRHKITGRYWANSAGSWYTDNLQEAKTYLERNDFRLKKLKEHEEVVMVEQVLKEITHD